MKAIFSAVFFTSVISAGFTQTLIPGNKEAIVKVLVLDKFEIPEQDALIIFKHMGINKVTEGRSDTAGKFEVILPQGRKYDIMIKKYGFDFEFGIREIPAVGGPLEFSMKFTIGIDTTYLGVYTLENVLFDYDKATLRSSSYPALNQLYETMKGNENMVVEIAGHTDNKGSDEYNQRLSQHRAESVKTFLVNKGIGKEQIYAKGYGEKSPIKTNNTEEGRQMNRRTEVRIIKE